MPIKDIIKHTHCPYAKKANLSGPIFINSLDILNEVRQNKIIISKFFIDAPKTDVDALCIVFTNPTVGNTIQNLTKYTKLFFKALETEYKEFKIPNQILDYNQKWWPTIENERFFMVSFANCYPENSPRFNYNDHNTYFFLQPVSSFERHAKDGNAIDDGLRQKIRNLFAIHSQPYDGEISSLKNELVKMVAPLKLGDPIIKWWKSE